MRKSALFQVVSQRLTKWGLRQAGISAHPTRFLLLPLSPRLTTDQCVKLEQEIGHTLHGGCSSRSHTVEESRFFDGRVLMGTALSCLTDFPDEPGEVAPSSSASAGPLPPPYEGDGRHTKRPHWFPGRFHHF